MRDATFDMMKGVGMIAVIVGHLGQLPHNWMECWHMPLFFLVSGYFFHSKGVWQTFKAGFKRLIIPCLIVGLIISLYEFTLSGYNPKVFAIGLLSYIFAGGNYFGFQLWGVLVMWFLYALFMLRIIYEVLRSRIYNNVELGFACLTLSGLAIFIGNRINIPFCTKQALSALVFYYIGNMARISHLTEVKIGGAKCIVLLIIWVIAALWSNMDFSSLTYTCYPMDVSAALSATYLIYLFCHLISQHENNITKYLEWFGRNSLIVMCIHDVEWYTNLLNRTLGRYGFFHLSNPAVRVVCVIGLASLLIFAYQELKKILYEKY